MNLKHLLKDFLRDDRGAVTVEWVVLTAGVVGLALALSDSLTTGIGTVAENITTYLEDLPLP